jgi:hypothetical protein
LGRVQVTAEDEGLVFDDGKGEGVRDDVYVFVGEIEPSVSGDVAEEVHALVEVCDGVGLVTN